MVVNIFSGEVSIRFMRGDPDKVNDFLSSGEKLGFFNAYQGYFIYKFSDELYDALSIQYDTVEIKKFWAEKFCRNGGVDKKEFINFQVLAWELREMVEKGEFYIEFYVNGKRFHLNLEDIENLPNKTIKEKIKYYKKYNPTKSSSCKAKSIRSLDYHTRLCCLCGDKNIILLKRS